MEIHIWTNGDPSVGLPGENATVEIEIPADFTAEDRNLVRTELQKAFSAIWDEKPHVAFQDELDDIVHDEGLNHDY